MRVEVEAEAEAEAEMGQSTMQRSKEKNPSEKPRDSRSIRSAVKQPDMPE